MRDIHMSTERFVEQVKEGYDSNLRYCFILGSGASYTSGIPTGLKLMPEWHKFLMSRGMGYIKECARDCGVTDDKLEQIFKPDYQFQSDDYFTLFDLRFAGMPVVAYKYLQKLMENAEPSIGYYMLAVLMDNTENKLVITTNFDSLVEDVLYMYHAKHPLVAGHESLAPFIGTVENMGRPVVAKVHRDLNLHPLNREKELKKLAKDWADNLHTAFSKYIPIVIGYAGGDQTLMNLLEKTDLDNIYWCSLNDSESERIEKLLHGCPGGYLVKINGFDDVMFRLVSKMMDGKSFDRPVERMKNLFKTRIENYNKQYFDIEHKYTEEENIRSSEKVFPWRWEGVDGRDNHSNASDNKKSTFDGRDTNAESELNLLNNMASTDDSPALKAFALRIEAFDYFKEKNYVKAIECCDKAIEIQPEATVFYRLKYIILSITGHYEEALEEIDKAIRLAPNNLDYHEDRGQVLCELGRYDEALEETDEMLRLEPANPRTHNFRGKILEKLNRYGEALEEKKEAIRLAPNNLNYHEDRGIVLFNLGRYDEALEETDEMLRLEPANPRTHNFRGMILEKLNRHGEALEEKKEAIRLAPNSAEFHNSLGKTLDQLLGHREEALKEKDKAIELDPDNAWYHNSRGDTLYLLARYDEALEEKKEAIRLVPNSAWLHHSLGVTLGKLRRHEEALKEKDEAVRLEPNNADYHYSRSITLHSLGRNDEALEEEKKAEILDPENIRYKNIKKQ